MRLLDIVTAPWAVLPAKLEEMHGVYETHLRGDKIRLEGQLAAVAKPPSADRQPYTLQGGVAIIPIDGVLTKRASWLSTLCGMTSMEMVGQDLQAALADERVQSIVLLFDSPGGTVDGTVPLADQVRAARDVKPVVALADGCCCSAAYWIASAAEKIYLTDSTTVVGSIGVVTTHTDLSGQEAAAGKKTTEITAGKYKRIASNYAPLSAEGQATIQADLDQIYSTFVDAVAENRGVSVETVLTQMADGRVFRGQQAIDAGLVDGVSTLAGLVSQLSQGRLAMQAGAGAALSIQNSNPSQEESMPITREQLATEAPELLTAIQAEGATAEIERVKGCLNAALPGHEDLAKALALDGKTTPDQAASAINAAERATLAAARQSLETGGIPPAKSAGDPDAAEAEAAAEKAKTAASKNQNAQALADRATELVHTAKTKGLNLSYSDAVAQAMKED